MSFYGCCLPYLSFMENKVRDVGDECPVWRRFRSGDRNAMAVIFNENYDSLYHYGKKLIQDEDLVKDCIQNLFLKVWTTRDKLMAVRFVRPYLLKALRRHIADQITDRNRKDILHGHFHGDFQITFSHEDFLIGMQTSLEQSQALARSLNNLAARQREAVFLKFYEDLDYTKIAEVMALNVQSVRNLIHQSLKSIKQGMNFGNILVNVGANRVSG